MSTGRSSRSGGGRGAGRGRGGRRGRLSGRGTALPSAFTGGRGAKGDERRKRGGGDRGNTGYEFDDGGGRVSDRHKYDDEAGDSDDGPGPEDSDFEDEEVDEDAAFDSADEARYGEVMDTILERRGGKRGGGSDEDAGESDDETDDDEGGGGGMSVMDMLAANEAAEVARSSEGGGKGNGKGKGQEKGRAIGDAIGDSSSRTAPASEVSGSSGEASGDEAELGGEAMDEEFSDEDDDDGEEDARHARLLGFVSTLGEQAAAAKRAAEDRRSSQLLQEGEFNPTAVVTTGGGFGSGGGVAKKNAVTMETLMASLQNSKGFAAVKKQVAAFSGKSGAPSAPASKAAELRAERETTYDSRKSEMGKWVAPVQANRKAETLDFTPSVKTNLSNAALASKMEATTDMEKEVEMLLTGGGAVEAGLVEREIEELKSKAFTVKEVKERQAELSKMRALMFYQERKQHHMNKIKSKVYRKIKKRQRERAGDGQAEADGDQAEVAARKRAEERMTLRHKNTTKWVKNALRAKGGAGKDDRRAIAEQLKLGQELRAKMDNVGNSTSDDNTSSEEEEEEEDEDAGGRSNGTKKKPALRDADRAALAGIGGEAEDEDGIPAGGKGAALLKMAFMQKALKKQRERAREEASEVLRELEDAAAEDNSSDDEARTRGGRKIKKQRGQRHGVSLWGGGDASHDAGRGVSARPSREARAKAAAEVAKALPPGALQSSSVSMDARVRSSVASPITIDLDGEAGDAGGRHSSSSSSSTPSADVEVGAGRDQAQPRNRPGDSAEAEGMAAALEVSKKRRQAEADIHRAGEEAESMSGEEDEVEEANGENPWLAPTPRRSKQRRCVDNGEVLLDVRKAATTALSALGGAVGNDEDAITNGNRGADATGSESGRKDGALASNGNAGQRQGSGRNRKRKRGRRKRGRSGGGNDGGGREGSRDDGFEKGSGKSASNGEADGIKEAKKVKRGQEDAVSHTAGKEKGNGDSAPAANTEAVQIAGGTQGGKAGKERPEGAGITKVGKRNGHAPAAKQEREKGNRESGSGGGNKKSAGESPGAKSTGANKQAKVAEVERDEEGAAKSALVGLSNEELVRRAFAAPDFDAEFKDSKDDEIEAGLATGRDKLPGSLAGWGSWAGDGARVPKGLKKRQAVAKKVQVKKEEAVKKGRKDDRLPKVVLSEKRQRRSAKYKVSEVPYPFTSREQYERSLRQPIGGEWNTSQCVRAMTRPAVVVRAGVAVAPMKLGKLHRDNARDGKTDVAAKATREGHSESRGGAGRRRGRKGSPKEG